MDGTCGGQRCERCLRCNSITATQRSCTATRITWALPSSSGGGLPRMNGAWKIQPALWILFFLKIRPWLQRRIGEVDASGFWVHNVRPWGLLSQLEQLTWPVSPLIFQGWDPTPGASCSSLMRPYCSVSHDYHSWLSWFLGCVDERCFHLICCHFLSFRVILSYIFRIIPCHVVSFWAVSRPSMSCNDSKWHEDMRWNETIEMTWHDKSDDAE